MDYFGNDNSVLYVASLVGRFRRTLSIFITSHISNRLYDGYVGHGTSFRSKAGLLVARTSTIMVRSHSRYVRDSFSSRVYCVDSATKFCNGGSFLFRLASPTISGHATSLRRFDGLTFQ